MGGLVGSAPICYGSSLGSNLDISQKYKMGDMTKEWPTHSSPAKNIQKKNYIKKYSLAKNFSNKCTYTITVTVPVLFSMKKNEKAEKDRTLEEAVR
jgi:hypothetical protein